MRLLLLAAAACADPASSTSSSRRYAVSAGAEAGVCADIGASRVCWRGDTPLLVSRELPSGAAPARGWRCGDEASARVCEDRGWNASPFACSSERCLQARPRLPDDGEWECVELSGVVYCHSRGDAAGMTAGPADLGWHCGVRRGTKGERICVDLDPDRPAPAALRRCRFELNAGTQQRVCSAGRATLVGSPCTAANGCPDGSRCSSGLCLPARPEPACWLDRDCEAGARCVFGSCAGAGA